MFLFLLGGIIMGNKYIKDMDVNELKNYIDFAYLSIENFLGEYVKLNKEKIENNKKITILRNRAYDIKDILEHVEWAVAKININDSISSRTNTLPKRGEIWTCQLGKNVGSEENKIRPVIILQNNTGNEKGPTTIIVPVSNRPKKIAVHISLKSSDYEIVKGEVEEVTGTILCEQIRVIAKARLGRHIATLKEDFLNNILEPKIRISLDIKNK